MSNLTMNKNTKAQREYHKGALIGEKATPEQIRVWESVGILPKAVTLRDILRPVIFIDFNGNEHPGILSNWRRGVATVTYDRIGEHGTIVQYGCTTYLADKDLKRIRWTT